MTRFTIKQIYEDLNKKGTLITYTLNEAISYQKECIGGEALYMSDEDCKVFNEIVREIKKNIQKVSNFTFLNT